MRGKFLLNQIILGVMTLSPVSLMPVVHATENTDLIWVQKSQRLMHLVQNYQIIRSYPVSLGQNPVGHKQTEGDSRTPEGLYFIDGKNPDSSYFLSLHISYPSHRDRLQAMDRQMDPGGNIMIHGEPNNRREHRTLNKADRQDWTQGCIAVSNRDMKEIWGLVEEGTPILIDP